MAHHLLVVFSEMIMFRAPSTLMQSVSRKYWSDLSSKYQVFAWSSNRSPRFRYLKSSRAFHPTGRVLQHRLFSSPKISTNSDTSPSEPNHDGENHDTNIYQELQWLSREIRRHDELYYSQEEEPELSDDEFDALVQREETLASTYPELLQKWQKESGLGEQATRQGRVGALQSTGDSNSDAAVSNTTLVVEPRLKRKHLAPMLSLDNVHNDEQLWAWLKRIPKVLDDNLDGAPTKVTIFTEPKLDGVSLSLRYQKRNAPSGGNIHEYELVWASTRGDGQQGQDVTAAVHAMNQTIPSQIFTSTALPDVVEIRGEVVLPNSDFASLADIAPNVTFSNARNAASGILLRKETEKEDELLEATQLRSKLLFYAYDMVAKDQLLLDGDEVQQMLKDAGFSIPAPVSKTELELRYNDTMADWSASIIEPMLTYYQALQVQRDGGITSGKNSNESKTRFKWGDFEMDGCVHKISQVEMRQLLGRSMKSPKWAVAHKFPPQAVVTKLLNVTIQVGRTGALTPVAVLEPVDIGGVTIQRATLHNFGHLQQVFGGTATAIGTSVLVRRAGDVIPQVVQRIGGPIEGNEGEDQISLEAPKECPACSSHVIIDEITSTSDAGQIIRCGGPPLLCPPRAITSLAHAFSRDAMDVTGLSEARIEQLRDADLLKLPSDLFQLTEESWAKIQELPGWGPKSSQNLRTNAERVATSGISLSRFIYSLGIRHMGKGTSELVASCYVTKDIFLQALDEASVWVEQAKDEGEEIAERPFSALQFQLGVGPVLIQSLMQFSKSKELMDAAKELGRVVNILDEEGIGLVDSNVASEKENDTQLPWKGLRVVFTGSIPGYSRSEAQKVAKRLGARATPGSVSKSTDLVVFGEKGGKKLDQARSLGIRTMTAEEFATLTQERWATEE